MFIPGEVKEFILRALQEDVGGGDVTTSLTVPEGLESKAEIIAKGNFVLAGMAFAREAFLLTNAELSFDAMIEDGTSVRRGEVLAKISGPARSILIAERVALNILQRLSGVATLTAKFVKRVEGHRAKVLDTRKTTPCMRFMEKYAVTAGGGQNHRFGLYDGVLIKDNHIEAAGGISRAVGLVLAAGVDMRVEVEAGNLKDVAEALEAGADIIMLDNMTVPEMKEAVKFVGRRALLEASGNVSLKNIREIAATGVDFISVGALTHSAPAADISMKIR